MEGVDRISCLPDEIILHIFSFLTVFDVVPTSVLSRRWRYLWTFSPKMEFPHCHDIYLNKPKYNVAAIDRCIKQYKSKQLHTLIISLNVNKDASKQVQEWFDFAIDKKVKHLHLAASHERYPKLPKVPSSLFSLQSLQHLALYNVELYPSLDIKCFDSLKHLCLYNVKVFDGALDSLLSKCHSLQTLFLNISPGPSNLCISLPHLEYFRIGLDSNYQKLDICAPNLLRFEITGCFSGKLHMANAPHLWEAVFYFQGDQMMHNEIWGPTMHNIANVKILMLRFDVFVLMCTEIYKNGRRLKLNNLKELHLDSSKRFDIPSHFLVSLLSDCPSTVGLYISVFCWERKSVFNKQQLTADMSEEYTKLTCDFQNCNFDNLERVEFRYFLGDPKQTTLVKFLLKKAKILQDMHLELGPMNKDYEDGLMGYLFKLPRISRRASISARSFDSPERSYKDSHWLINYGRYCLDGICSYMFSLSR